MSINKQTNKSTLFMICIIAFVLNIFTQDKLSTFDITSAKINNHTQVYFHLVTKQTFLANINK